jgi:amino acid adenylation domain-containing protein
MTAVLLHELVSRAAAATPDAVAVYGPDATVTYGDLDARANRVARALAQIGVRAGDRVGIWLAKSAEAVAAMQAALRIGAVYVPVDPLSPVARARTVLADCGVKALIARRDAAHGVLSGELADVTLLEADGWSGSVVNSLSAAPLETAPRGPHDLAYLLYTSGSTGKPKGVCITHSNALAFVAWAVDAIGATAADRFANHAPFHFDLSVLDLYAAFSVGASVSIVPEGAAYTADEIVQFVCEKKITVWYSVPSAIVLMMINGALLTAARDRLRVLIFAGEAFPIKQLRVLRSAWPEIPMWNLYGPTETNVCTAFRVDTIGTDATNISIGRAVCGDRVWARKEDGSEAMAGEEGELMVQGPTVFPGYWGQPCRGDEPYATGDIARRGADDNYYFVGRRDNMVKVRGYRVELGEIEAALLEHRSIGEAAAMVIGTGIGTRLIAALGIGAQPAPTLLEIKQHCAARLPRYMIPDDILLLAALPRNRNGKVDRRELAATMTSPTQP